MNSINYNYLLIQVFYFPYSINKFTEIHSKFNIIFVFEYIYKGIAVISKNMYFK